jgi:hypothetical protein
MFLFFVGGVNTNIKKVIQQDYGPCASCITGRMDLVERAKTLNVFLVPLWNFDKRIVLTCRQCRFTCSVSNYEALQRENASQPFHIGTAYPERHISCRYCGTPISNQWIFCPACGVAADYQCRQLAVGGVRTE